MIRTIEPSPARLDFAATTVLSQGERRIWSAATFDGEGACDSFSLVRDKLAILC
jgi:hypothetical protein